TPSFSSARQVEKLDHVIATSHHKMLLAIAQRLEHPPLTQRCTLRVPIYFLGYSVFKGQDGEYSLATVPSKPFIYWLLGTCSSIPCGRDKDDYNHLP
ncbi:MAG: hypothetical protein FWF78_02195, partial [Defluviitaleaceae bacterium]|nr:hypothetical protein [Defluviitaleaceae bacterium]